MSIFVHSELGRVIEKSWKGDVETLDPIALERLNLLSQHGDALSPAVAVFTESDNVSILQKWVHNTSHIDEFNSQKVAESLANEVAMIHSKGLVHGDLCYSNVGLHKKEVLIFDWEPVLIHWHSDGRVEYRTSKFAFHPKDRSSQRVTQLSDRFALVFLVLQIIHERFEGLQIGKNHLDQIIVLSESIQCCRELADHIIRLHWCT